MKSSRDLKVGVTLLVIALAVGVFALVVWADGHRMYGMYGMRGGSSGDIETPRYGMQRKEFSNQMHNQDCQGCEDCVGYLGSGMVNRNNAPDDDGDGIPNGQDDDYKQHDCDEECDGTCDSEPKGRGMGRNAYKNENDGISEYPVHINGRDLKIMKISEVAQVWGIDGDGFLAEMTKEFNLQQEYTTDNTIDDLRGEYRFSSYQIMEIVDRINS